MPISALWIKHFPLPHFFVLAIKCVWVMTISANYPRWIIWAQNQRALRLWASFACWQQKRTEARLIPDDMKGLEQPQIFEVDNSDNTGGTRYLKSLSCCCQHMHVQATHSASRHTPGEIGRRRRLQPRDVDVQLTGCSLGVCALVVATRGFTVLL